MEVFEWNNLSNNNSEGSLKIRGVEPRFIRRIITPFQYPIKY